MNSVTSLPGRRPGRDFWLERLYLSKPLKIPIKTTCVLAGLKDDLFLVH